MGYIVDRGRDADVVVICDIILEEGASPRASGSLDVLIKKERKKER